MNGRLLAFSALCTAVVVTNIKLAIHNDNNDATNQDDSPLRAQILDARSSQTSTSLKPTNRTKNVAHEQIIVATEKQSSSLRSRSNEALKTPETSDRQQDAYDRISSQPNGTSTVHRLSNRTSKVAGLDCSAYGGPTDASGMIYWRDIPEDDRFQSPYPTDSEKFITFEPDEGGFNNVRMALETVVSMAVAMGRTLVLPPSQELYLLHGNNVSSQHLVTKCLYDDFVDSHNRFR
jgi:hypothetical protein